MIRSADPFDAPRITPNALSHEDDVAEMLAGPGPHGGYVGFMADEPAFQRAIWRAIHDRLALELHELGPAQIRLGGVLPLQHRQAHRVVNEQAGYEQCQQAHCKQVHVEGRGHLLERGAARIGFNQRQSRRQPLAHARGLRCAQHQVDAVIGIGDPLLFIEMVPMAETRAFVERVMANYWIYRLRMGQPTPSLDEKNSASKTAFHPMITANRKPAKM